MADIAAIRNELRADIVAATGVMTNFDQMLIAGKQQDVKVIGTDEDYAAVRNIVISNGRFLDPSDVAQRQKVALLTDQLAERMYGSRAPPSTRSFDSTACNSPSSARSMRRWKPSANPKWSATPS